MTVRGISKTNGKAKQARLEAGRRLLKGKAGHEHEGQRRLDWAVVREEYHKLQQMGWQSVQQAATVGELLIALKKKTPHGEWAAKLKRALSFDSQGSANVTAANLMRLAAHLPLLEKHKPDSQRAALVLIKEENGDDRQDRQDKYREDREDRKKADAPDDEEDASDDDGALPPDQSLFTSAFYEVSASLYRAENFLRTLPEDAHQWAQGTAYQNELQTMTRYVDSITQLLKGLIK